MEPLFYNPRFHSPEESPFSPLFSYEEVDTSSITEPDLALSTQELLERYTRGMPVTDSLTRPAFFDDVGDDDETIDPRYKQNRDLTDIDESRNYYTQAMRRYVDYRNQRIAELNRNKNNLNTQNNEESVKDNN